MGERVDRARDRAAVEHATAALAVLRLTLAALVHFGVSVAETLLIVAAASLGAAYLAWLLHKACD